MVSARAVAVTTSTSVVSCNFCSLNKSASNHTLLIKNGARLRVDGDIHANSRNGGVTPGVCVVKTWKVCGDGFDIFGDGGTISARHITVVGGWETHDGNIATADELAPGCTESYTPTGQKQPSNVCVHMPEIPDPFNDPAKPGAKINPPTPGAVPVPGTNGCPGTAVVPAGSISLAAQTRITTGTKVVCPGTYYGGLQMSGGETTMLPGVYIMVGGGFQVLNKADVDGKAGVMVYTTGSAGGSHSTSLGTSLVPDGDPSKTNVRNESLIASDKSIAPGDVVTFTFEMEIANKSAPAITGYVDFYDGNVMLCGAAPVIRDSPTSKGFSTTCSTSYALWGVRSIAAVYSGDAIYDPAGDALTVTVTAPSGIKDGPITIDGTGRVDLYGPASGPYAGMTIF
ncbi:MAG: Ig-like domain repeat protein [Chloroflexi bacterium]|nr:Ig-like domain repeat protein [Chloroflexota bacterium]